MPNLYENFHIMDIPDHLEIMQAIADQLMDDAEHSETVNIHALYKRVVEQVEKKIRQRLEGSLLREINKAAEQISTLNHANIGLRQDLQRAAIREKNADGRNNNLVAQNETLREKKLKLTDELERQEKRRIALLALMAAQEREIKRLAEENERIKALIEPETLTRRRRSIS